jgi:hypothetical protein
VPAYPSYVTTREERLRAEYDLETPVAAVQLNRFPAVCRVTPHSACPLCGGAHPYDILVYEEWDPVEHQFVYTHPPCYPDRIVRLHITGYANE